MTAILFKLLQLLHYPAGLLTLAVLLVVLWFMRYKVLLMLIAFLVVVWLTPKLLNWLTQQFTRF